MHDFLEIKEWTHKNIPLEDIRFHQPKTFDKNNIPYYSVKFSGISEPLTINHQIMDERIRNYWLINDTILKRELFTNVNWNLLVTDGYYLKLTPNNGEFKKIPGTPKRLYLSFLEIAGDLGFFDIVFKRNANF